MTKPEDKIPKWVLEKNAMTTRQFKEWFRIKLHYLANECNSFACYAGYLPEEAFYTYIAMQDHIYQLKQILSQKEWGR